MRLTAEDIKTRCVIQKGWVCIFTFADCYRAYFFTSRAAARQYARVYKYHNPKVRKAQYNLSWK
jgi:hypothetical protein